MVDKDVNSAATVLSKIYVFLLIICLDQNQPKLLHKLFVLTRVILMTT